MFSKLAIVFALLNLIDTTIQSEHFIGDVHIKVYLKNLCKSHPNVKIVLTNPNSNMNELEHYLSGEKCKFYTFNKQLADLRSEIKRNSIFKYNQVLFIFYNLGNISNADKLFHYLQELSPIYADCSRCLPFVLLFESQSVETLYAWAIQAKAKGLLSILQSTLVSISSQLNSVVHIQPVLDGCRMCNGVYWPKTRRAFERLKVPFNKCSLNYTILKASVNQIIPFCDLSYSGDGKIEANYGIETELLKLLQHKYHFSTQLVDAQQNWGVFVNGSWTGTVKQVTEGTTNFALCCITASLERLTAVDFTRFTILDDFTWISQRPSLYRSSLTLASPFQPQLWLCVICFFLFISYVTHYIGKTYFGRPCYQKMMLNMFGILINRGLNAFWRERKQPIRILLAVWLFGALVLTNMYCSDLYSILTVPLSANPIDTINDLIDSARSDHHYIFLVNYSAIWEHVVYSNPNDGMYYEIGLHINRTKKDMIINVDTELISKAEESPQNIVMGDRVTLEIYRHLRARKQLHIGIESIWLDNNAIMLPKKSALKNPFNLIIVRVQEMGLMEYWLRNVLSKSRMASSAQLGHSELQHSFGLNEFYVIFIVWSLGIAASITRFLYEVSTFASEWLKRKVVLVIIGPDKS